MYEARQDKERVSRRIDVGYSQFYLSETDGWHKMNGSPLRKICIF